MTLQTASTLAAIKIAGYSVAEDSQPAVRCAFEPLETWVANSWEALATFVCNYDVCDCGRH